MMLEDIVTVIGLNITQPYLMVGIVIFGYLLINEKLFSKALMLLLFTMVYNVYLKALWKIPLPPSLGIEGWAFPSGHMHSAFVFWGWLAFESKNRYFMGGALMLLACAGFALVHKGYHYPLDVIGAMLFGTVTLTIFHVANLFEPFKTKFMLNGLWLSAGAAFFMFLTPDLDQKLHVYQGIGALIGFTLGGLFAQRRSLNALKGWHQLWQVVFVFTILFGCFQLSHYLPHTLPRAVNVFLTWFVIALWIASSKRVLKMPPALRVFNKTSLPTGFSN